MLTSLLCPATLGRPPAPVTPRLCQNTQIALSIAGNSSKLYFLPSVFRRQEHLPLLASATVTFVLADHSDLTLVEHQVTALPDTLRSWLFPNI